MRSLLKNVDVFVVQPEARVRPKGLAWQAEGRCHAYWASHRADLSGEDRSGRDLHRWHGGR